jgi:uncharacterized membrane protein YhaH (DUF805 family)
MMSRFRVSFMPWFVALVVMFACAGLTLAQNASPDGLAKPQQGFGPAGGVASQAATQAAAQPWRPFLDPVIIHDSWYLLIIPMAFLMSMAYKAVRCHDMRRYWRAVIAMTIQVVLGMIALGAGFWMLIEFVLPRIAP